MGHGLPRASGFAGILGRARGILDIARHIIRRTVILRLIRYTLGHPVTPYDTPWHLMTPYGTLCHPMTPYATLCHPMTPFDTLWHPLTPYDTL